MATTLAAFVQPAFLYSSFLHCTCTQSGIYEHHNIGMKFADLLTLLLQVLRELLFDLLKVDASASIPIFAYPVRERYARGMYKILD